MNISTEFTPVPTRAALLLQKQKKASDFKALVFKEPKPEQRLDATNEHPESEGSKTKRVFKRAKDEPEEFDMKKARHEVLNFAINNQRVIKNKKKMQIFQAVKLGAKPPKKPNRNYKELLDERKRLKTIREERKKFHQLGKNQAGAASVKCRSKTKVEKQKKKRAPVTGIDQHYGKAKPKLKKK